MGSYRVLLGVSIGFYRVSVGFGVDRFRVVISGVISPLIWLISIVAL